MYKIHIENRKYSVWSCLEVATFKQVELEAVCPVKEKLFSNDVFSITEHGEVKQEFSSVKQLENIPGVLDLSANKTYGREHNGSGKLLYKVVPDDIRLPVFLVPYEQKYMGFSKVFVNLYVTFKFISWEGKHPVGKLTSTIGRVDVLSHFYEYQLFCRSLNASIQTFNKTASKSVKTLSANQSIDDIIDKYEGIEDRRKDWHVFTIDPPTSTDFDDGFSIKKGDDGISLLSIYISNVTILLDVLNLWGSFSRRVSTIYLPDRKRPMLPTILSDNLCSLQEKNTRFALAMDIRVDESTGEIKDIEYRNCAIRVFKNYRYEEKTLGKDKDYQYLAHITEKLANKYKYIRCISNSHDVVCYLMTLMNYHCAQDLLSHHNGIFRSSILKNENLDVPTELSQDAEKFIKIWYSSGGCYINASSLENNLDEVRHELMNMDAYVHITSPIRRLVDLLNMIQFQKNRNMIGLSEEAYKFYEEWTSEEEMTYINTTMRSIKKVQNDCSTLEFYTNNEEAMEEVYEGIMFDKMLRNDGTYQYVVYLSKLRLTLKINLHMHYENFTKGGFKLFLFEDEETLRRKIRIQKME